ncbi:MAG: DNA-directed RNA polymerase subunit omega [Bacteroidales bacterium]|jgi:DNA-directed RNA polymerase subunit K/omega|nr:DNA-directed RNA polymerase subunit omega [Bacteroidales bacterium]
MDNKNISKTIKTRDINAIAEKTGNIYKSVVICSKRSNQISVNVKKEITEKLSQYSSYNDNLEEIHENREQIEVSKYFELQPKPALIALEELLEDQILFSNPEEVNENEF